MKASRFVLVLAAAAISGCSGATGLSTEALFGNGEPEGPTAPINDPPMRAFQVGTVSARAIKCGFNFDPAKLKAAYLAYERTQAGGTADVSRIEKIYDVSFNGVAKAVAGESEYCSATKTKTIKADLTRHLAGDYAPSEQPKVQQEEGLFTGWGSDGSEGGGVRSTLPGDNSDI